MTSVSVVVPAYNEERTILKVLQQISRQKIPGVTLEVIVVDDGSKDRTAELIKSQPDLYAKCILRPTNGGKGAAVRDGLRAATGDYVMIQDADLEYDPADYPRLFKPILLHDADVVLGSRFVAPEITRVFYFTHKLGNLFITLLFNVLNNTTFTDVYCGALVYRRDLIDPDELRTSGWQQHAEMLSKVVRRALSIYEIPVSYHGRTIEEGKKIRSHHIFGIICTIVAGRFTSGRKARHGAAPTPERNQPSRPGVRSP